MYDLEIPVPECVTACYVVPLTKPMSDNAVRKLIIKAVRSRLGDPLTDLVINLVRDGHTEIRVLNQESGRSLSPVPETDDPDARALLRAGAYVVITITDRPSLGAMQELITRATAGSLAAHIGAPLFNAESEEISDPGDALAALPGTVNATAGGIRIRVNLNHWVTFDGFEHDGSYVVASDGMRRYGLPDLMMCDPQPKDLLRTVAVRFWSFLSEQTITAWQTLPELVHVPATMTIDGQHVGLSLHEGSRTWLRAWQLSDVETPSLSVIPAPPRSRRTGRAPAPAAHATLTRRGARQARAGPLQPRQSLRRRFYGCL
jgi:hypothetical protein